MTFGRVENASLPQYGKLFLRRLPGKAVPLNVPVGFQEGDAVVHQKPLVVIADRGGDDHPLIVPELWRVSEVRVDAEVDGSIEIERVVPLSEVDPDVFRLGVVSGECTLPIRAVLRLMFQGQHTADLPLSVPADGRHHRVVRVPDRLQPVIELKGGKRAHLNLPDTGKLPHRQSEVKDLRRSPGIFAEQFVKVPDLIHNQFFRIAFLQGIVAGDPVRFGRILRFRNRGSYPGFRIVLRLRGFFFLRSSPVPVLFRFRWDGVPPLPDQPVDALDDACPRQFHVHAVLFPQADSPAVVILHTASAHGQGV